MSNSIWIPRAHLFRGQVDCDSCERTCDGLPMCEFRHSGEVVADFKAQSAIRKVEKDVRRAKRQIKADISRIKPTRKLRIG